MSMVINLASGVRHLFVFVLDTIVEDAGLFISMLVFQVDVEQSGSVGLYWE